MSTDSSSPVLVWFRDDHRLTDNPAFVAAAATGSQILCFAIVDDGSDELRPLGGAARWWLHGSLQALEESLERAGFRLILFKGPALSMVEKIALETSASAIFWNRRYGAAEIALDSAIKKRLMDRGIKAHSFNGRLLHEPWEITNQAGKPFQVFTPYLRAVMARTIATPLSAPKQISGGTWPSSLLASATPLAKLSLEPSSPDWAGGMRDQWQRGEEAARAGFKRFLREGLKGYADNRDRPSFLGTSRLSPHLRFGEIGPRQIWHAVRAQLAHEPGLARDAEKYLSEIVWRDFSHQLLTFTLTCRTDRIAAGSTTFPELRTIKASERGRRV